MKICKSAFLVSGVLVGILLLANCSDTVSNNGNDAKLYSCDQYLSNSGSIVTQGTDTLIFNWAQKISQISSCNGTTFLSRLDTTVAKSDSFFYKVKNDSLFLTTTKGKLDGATIYALLLNNSGTGNGLSGTWRYDTVTIDSTGLNYRITLAVINVTNIMVTIDNAWKTLLNGYYWSVSGSTIKQYSSTFFADTYIPSLTLEGIGDTTRYNLTVTRASNCLVTIASKLPSGETVTVYGDNMLNVNYSSSNPAHLAYINYKNPPTLSNCPNKNRPEWWVEFLGANVK